jgi:hypothetical protein
VQQSGKTHLALLVADQEVYPWLAQHPVHLLSQAGTHPNQRLQEPLPLNINLLQALLEVLL